MSAPTPPGSPRPRRLARRAAGLLAGLAVAAALAVPPAVAQNAADPNDQSTPGTVRDAAPADRPTGGVSPPSAIRPSTEVVPDERGGTTRTDPLDHLSPSFRRDR